MTLLIADGELSSESNADGYFILSLATTYSRDTLTMTALNHEAVRVPLTSLVRTDSTISLPAIPTENTSGETYFDTVPFATRDTLLKVVAAIGRTYSQQPTLLHGFYCETISADTSRVPTMEVKGLIKVYKHSYHFPRAERPHSLSKRSPEAAESTYHARIDAGTVGEHMLDVVKYQEFLFRNRTANKNYEFARMDDAVIGNQPVYVIQFRPRDKAQSDGYFTGQLFVKKNSLAIIRTEYTLTPSGLNLLNQAPGYVQLYNTRLLQRTYVTNYVQCGQTWSFQSGSVENLLAHDASASQLTARIDFVITRRNNDQIKPISHFAEAAMRLPMQPFDATDDSFWQGETYLLPTRP